MNGKVAVCFYGLLRSNQKVSDLYIKNLLEPLNADLFIATSDLFYAPPSDDYDRPKDAPLVSYLEKYVDENYIKSIYHKYIKSYIIFNYDNKIFKNIIEINDLPKISFQTEIVWRTLSMFYHIKEVIRLKNQYEKDNNIKYDITILARPDLEINNRIEINNLDENIVYFTGEHRAFVFYYGNLTNMISTAKSQNKGIYLEDLEQEGHNWNDYGENKIISDHLLISRSENINVLSTIFDSIIEYNNNNNNGIILSNETLIGYTFIKNNINFKYDNFLKHKVKY